MDQYPKILKLYAKKEFYDCLLWSAEYGFLRMVKFLTDNCGTMNALDPFFDRLDYAIKGGHLEIVKFLIDKYPDIGLNHNAYFCSATETGNLEIIRLFQNDIQIYDWMVSDATQKGDLELIRFFYEKGFQFTSYHLKSALEHSDLFLFMLNTGVILNSKLLIESIQKDNLSGVSLLLDLGIDVETGSPLLVAVTTGNLEITRLLLKYGANPKYYDLVFSARNLGRIQMVQLLEQYT